MRIHELVAVVEKGANGGEYKDFLLCATVLQGGVGEGGGGSKGSLTAFSKLKVFGPSKSSRSSLSIGPPALQRCHSNHGNARKARPAIRQDTLVASDQECPANDHVRAIYVRRRSVG